MNMALLIEILIKYNINDEYLFQPKKLTMFIVQSQDLNLGTKNGRHRRTHWTMAAPEL